MEQRQGNLISPVPEVPVLEGEVVTAVRGLRERGWGVKAIARELGVARNTVRRYVRGALVGVQHRPASHRLTAAQVTAAQDLFSGTAAGNAVVVQQLLAAQDCVASVRTVQRAVAPVRQARRAADVATVRVETAPGAQLQVDFGEKRLLMAGALVTIFLLVAVLSYSRRIFVKPFHHERQDDWREGIAAAFVHFGGVPQTILGDNARALVLGRDRQTGTVTFHPAYLAFCRDWDTQPKACAPYRARTKGKVESGVKYVKRNALADRAFESMAGLEAHLGAWMIEADTRVHGTTHERPLDRFVRAEQAALRPLPSRAMPIREQRVRRRVAHDAFVDVETVRYSVPYRFVRDHVEVAVDETTVRIFHGPDLIATHGRCREPFARVLDPAHVAGLWRPSSTAAEALAPTLAPLGRSLADYAAVIGGAQ
jgi:transposase